ncbi:MAG: hypothetical protein LUO97_03120 [Methanomicrobiales archaeon]|nr:hypothetical protein [Methanomicrobiales archaeon]
MKILSMAIAALLVLGFTGTVAAGTAQGISGRDRAGHLYLFEKNPSTWAIVAGGAWGIMSYQLPDGRRNMEKFVFSGHHLAPETDYSLIYNPDPWPGRSFVLLGKGTSDALGEVYFTGGFNFDAIFIGDEPAARFRLVLSSDVGPSQMTGWNPTEYLFEK